MSSLTKSKSPEGSDQTFVRRLACEKCRASKIKCLKDPTLSGDRCRRCHETGAECSFAPVVTKRRRKRTDARVTALEREIEKIVSRIHQRRSGNHGRPESHTLKATTNHEDDDEGISERSNSSEHAFLGIPSTTLSKKDAIELLDEFVESIVPQYPIVLLEDATFESLYSTKPTLLLAAITAASSARSLTLFETLHAHLVDHLTDQIFVKGEASLELIQAILIMEAWYCPPKDIRRAGFYQWIHVSATMSLQLGLGGSHNAQTGFAFNNNLSGLMEESRTLLAVFLLCSSAAVSMRRESMLRLTPSVQNSLKFLSEHAVSSGDRRLLAWLRLQLLAEEMQGMNSCQTSIQGDSYQSGWCLDAEIQRLEHQFNLWAGFFHSEIMNESLTMHYLFCKARLSEIRIQNLKDLDTLIAPYLPTPVRVEDQRQNHELAGRLDTEDIQAFTQACYAILNAFWKIDTKALGKCPNVTYIRALYAVKALILVRQDATSASLGSLEIIDYENSRFQDYLSRIRVHLVSTEGLEELRIPEFALQIFDQLQEYHMKWCLSIHDVDVEEDSSPAEGQNRYNYDSPADAFSISSGLGRNAESWSIKALPAGGSIAQDRVFSRDTIAF